MAWYDFDFSSQGASGFGHKDLWHFQEQGLTNAQIRVMGELASRQGRNISGTAFREKDAEGNVIERADMAHEWSVRDWLNQNTTAGPIAYGSRGKGSFDMDDIQAQLDRGATWRDIQRYKDYADEHKIGSEGSVSQWLSDNIDNYNYMDAEQRREVGKQDALEAEKRAQEQWLENIKTQKEMNPRVSSNNAAMQSKGSGGVAIKRSPEFRRAGGTRSTAQAGRDMFIESLNI